MHQELSLTVKTGASFELCQQYESTHYRHPNSTELLAF